MHVDEPGIALRRTLVKTLYISTFKQYSKIFVTGDEKLSYISNFKIYTC